MLLLLLLVAIFTFFFYHFYWKRRNLPPGPLPLPFIGNLLTLKKYEPGYDAFLKWKKEYGPVFTYWMGPTPFVLITDYQIIKDTVIQDGDAYTDRFVFLEVANIFRGGRHGIMFTTGDVWREHRRFALHVLRNFGLGKNLMMERVLAEVGPMIDRLRVDSQAGPVNIADYFDQAVGSVINNLLFGYRFDEKTLPEFKILKTQLSKNFRDFANPKSFFVFNFPWLMELPFFSHMKEMIYDHKRILFGFFKRQIKEHEAVINWDTPIDDSTDYVEYFLKEMKRRKDDPDNTFTYPQLESMCLDLWMAGMETTSNTLTWSILFILHNPYVLGKIHQELDAKIGSKRVIEFAERNELHYLNAFIAETQRVANLLPQNLLRRTIRDVEIAGFKLPAKTNVIPQISSVLLDETVFENPREFRPERFLDENGQFKKVEELVPFSIGKRICLGEGLARMELFLFLANLLNRFEVLPEDPNNLPTLRKHFSATVQAQPYKVRMQPRN